MINSLFIFLNLFTFFGGSGIDASGLKRSVGVSEPLGESPSLIELLKK